MNLGSSLSSQKSLWGSTQNFWEREKIHLWKASKPRKMEKNKSFAGIISYESVLASSSYSWAPRYFHVPGCFSDKLMGSWERVYFVLRIIIDSKPVSLIAIVKLSARKASSSYKKREIQSTAVLSI